MSDSFYSTATHRAGNLPDLSKIKTITCPSLSSLLPGSVVPFLAAVSMSPCEWVHLPNVWGTVSSPN